MSKNNTCKGCTLTPGKVSTTPTQAAKERKRQLASLKPKLDISKL